MALTSFQIVKGEKTFKGKSIAEISYSFWIFDILSSENVSSCPEFGDR